MNPLPTLKKSLRNKTAIKFLITQTENDYCFGVVVRLTPEFVALGDIESFEYDGFVVFPLTEVREFVEDGRVRCANRILNGNGQLEKLRPPKWLDKCDTIEDIFNQMKKRDIWPSIQVKEGTDEWYFLGVITEVEPAGFIIRHYDNTGKWVERYPIGLPSVTKVTFNSRYVKHFANYMKSRQRQKLTS